jgi:hypothetical protein
MTTNPPLAEFHPLSLDSLQNIGYSLTEMAESMPNALPSPAPAKDNLNELLQENHSNTNPLLSPNWNGKVTKSPMD